MAQYGLTPVTVPRVETKYRTIKTKLPVPESLEIFKKLALSEPRSMMGQPPLIWDRAEGFQVEDKWGNRWLDWSSGVLIANSGHGRKEVQDALKAVIDKMRNTSPLDYFKFISGRCAEFNIYRKREILTAP